MQAPAQSRLGHRKPIWRRCREAEPAEAEQHRRKETWSYRCWRKQSRRTRCRAAQGRPRRERLCAVTRTVNRSAI